MVGCGVPDLWYSISIWACDTTRMLFFLEGNDNRLEVVFSRGHPLRQAMGNVCDQSLSMTNICRPSYRISDQNINAEL